MQFERAKTRSSFFTSISELRYIDAVRTQVRTTILKSNEVELREFNQQNTSVLIERKLLD